jgi:VWFA-related protein
MRFRPVVAVAVAFLAAGSDKAQTTIPKVGETIDVSIVNVDVVVTDRRGNHIQGLTAADFEIRDNGVPQPITNFAEYKDDASGLGAQASVSSPTPSSEDRGTEDRGPLHEKRTIVLFVERQVLPPAQADAFVDSLKKLLHDSIRGGDAAAVVSFRYATKVEQDFTSDMGKLDAAVNRLRPMFDRFGEDTEGQALRNAYMQELLDEDAAAAGGSSAPALTLNGTDEATRELVDMRRKVHMLNILVNAMAAVDGRKAILLATRRFGQYAGWEFIGSGLGMPSGDAEHFNTRELRDELTRNANAAGVTFYAVYPEGLVDIPVANVQEGPRRGGSFYRNDPARDGMRLGGKASGILVNETTAIGDLAAKTGGTYGYGFTDIAKIAETMRNDLSSYYSLAFRTPEKAKTHKISVTTKNHSYVVRARREFVAKSEETQMTDRIVSALYQPQRAARLPIDVQVLSVTKTKRRYHIPIVIRIPAASLTMLPSDKGPAGTFRVYAAAGGVLGINSDVYEKSQPFTVPAGVVDPAKIFTYEFEMVTDTRTDRIAIGVLDELSKDYGVIRVMLNPAGAQPAASK